MNEKIEEQLRLLAEKYDVMGQDLSSYLEGLLHADFLTYWDYIHLDTLMSLQTPKTGFKDEMIFIGYHQITELYFKLVLWEMKQMTELTAGDHAIFLKKLKRCCRYMEHLVHSFDVMVDGMDPEQFLKFRMSLLPASGFQSCQYRLIEVYATDFYRLAATTHRDKINAASSIPEIFDHLYWRTGASELATGRKTLTLRQFEEKYRTEIEETAASITASNLWQMYVRYFKQANDPELINEMKFFDRLTNIDWPLAHYRSAVKYLQKDPVDIAATGGTNWQKYLPPRFQLVMFYPELWTEEEKSNWGKVNPESKA